MTTILIKKKDTAGAPAAGDLTNAAGGAEIAVNTATKRIYTKDSGGNVVEVGTNPTATTMNGNLTFVPDATYDIGASGVTRPRNLFLSGAATLGTALTVPNGGTGLTTLATGSLSYGAGTSAFSTLAIGTAGQILTSSGTAPQWSTLSGVAVTTFSAGTTGFTPSSATAGAVTLAGTLATTNGGTGLTSFTSGGVVYASSSSALATGSALTFDGTALTSLNNASSQSIILSRTSATARNWALGIDGDGGFRLTDATGSAVMLSIIPSGVAYLASASELIFKYNTSVEGMRLTSNGLGIGNTAPAYKLTVNGSTGIGVGATNNAGMSLTFSGAIGGDSISEAAVISATYTAYGTNSAGALLFTTNSGSGLTEKMRLNAGGSLTLGATEVAGSVGSMTITVGAGGSVSTPLSLRNPGTASGSGVQMSFRGATNGGAEYDYAYIGMLATNTSNGQGAITFSTSNNGSPSERMRLNNSGQLQVGLNNTSYVGQIQSKGLVASSGTNTYWPLTISAGATADTGGYTSMIGLGVEGHGWSKGAIGYTRTGSYDTGYIAFYLNPSANSDTVTLSDEKARFTKEGAFYVGTTTAYLTEKFNVTSASNQKNALFNNTNASYTELILNLRGSRNTSNGTWGFLQCSRDGIADVLYIYDSGNVVNTNGSYGAISDAKLKENIVDASPKLADLMQVKVRNYNLKFDPTHKQIGVVAQELETVFPSMIDETPDRDAEGNVLETTTKSVKYSVFVPMLIKAMQEQQAIIESLKARLDAANI